MNYAKLGQTGMEVSRITFGCWELGGGMWEKAEDEVNIKLLQTAFDQGVNSFDTAEGYGDGHSEKIVGLALDGKRKECFLATKVSKANLRRDDLRRAVENSLKRLRTDYLDLYYVHWPNPEIPLQETMTEMNRLKEEGIIRAIGVSNFSLSLLQQAQDYARVDVIQPEYSLLQREIEDELLPYCREQSIAVMAYSPLTKGILTGAFHFGNAKLKEDDFRRTRRFFLPEHLEKEEELLLLIKEIAEAKGVSLSQVALAWLLAQPGLTSAIVGTQKEQHLLDNLQATELQLTQEELEKLDRVSRKVIASL
ncbi:MAG: aldo/keto reductase [Firmicutes bacterium]|nr:aldo/keto reductase [Bacillota bacterium]